MAKKIIRKIFGALLIIVSLLVVLVPGEAIDADTKSPSDFKLNGNILVKYTGTASVVSIPDYVEIIGEEAFSDNPAIYSITIPNSVEQINYAAFSGCTGLEKIKVPDSVEIIDSAAFCNCSRLSEVEIGTGLKKLGNGVFTGCDKLKKISIASTRFSLADGVIYDKEKTKIYQYLPGNEAKSYSMPITVSYVCPYSFYGCSNINSVTLSPEIQEISAYSFSNCNGLFTVKIPYSVNNIDAKAFENCVNLCDVDIPESVTYIHPTAFDGCPRLNIIAPEFSYAYNFFKNMDRSQVAIIDTEENISDISDVSGNDVVTTVYPPSEQPLEWDSMAQVDDSDLIGESIVVGRKAFVFLNNAKPNVYGNGNFTGLMDIPDLPSDVLDVFDTKVTGKGLNIPKFSVIGDKISNKAFYGDVSLTSYSIDPSVKKIGDFSFARSNLTSIEIPEGVTDIGYGAFYHCDNLSKISVPSTVTNIEPAAFAKTKMIEDWYSNGQGEYLVVGDGILVAYRGKDSKITIPEGIKQIGPEAFKDHMGITDLSLPDSLWRICEDAFSGCSNLSSISGGMNLVSIEDRAFKGCPLETVRIVDSVQNIGFEAFDYSNTKALDENKACVFLGDILPKVTYNKTATRLSNEPYRHDSLQDVKVAIVKNSEVNLEGTILDKNVSGFSGLVCTVFQENSEYKNGILSIIACTLSKEEAENFSVPSSMIIFGKGYNFDEVQLSNFLNLAKEGQYEKAPVTGDKLIKFEGSDREYFLDITENSTVLPMISESYERIYGEAVPSNMYTFDIMLREKETGVALTKFGKQKLLINVPLPDSVPSNNLHVICTDEDGQLEDLSYTLVEDSGKLCVSFDILHTGHYGLYSYNSSAVISGKIDETPDTGEGFNPKYLLGAGLFCAGLVFLLIKKKY